MTRDEAIAVVRRHYVIANSVTGMTYGLHQINSCANSEVDMLVALGLLKLDEPKTPEQKLLDAMVRENVVPNYFAADNLKYLLGICGLKIVEK